MAHWFRKPGLLATPERIPKFRELNALKTIDPKLGSYIFANLDVLYDSDIDIPDGIRAHYISTGFADPLPLRNSIEIKNKGPCSLSIAGDPAEHLRLHTIGKILISTIAYIDISITAAASKT